MGKPASITDAEFGRLATLAKAQGVAVRYQRKPDMPVIEIVPDIPANHKPMIVDQKDEGPL